MFVVAYWWVFIVLGLALAAAFAWVQARNIKALWEGGLTSQSIAWALALALASAMSLLLGLAGLVGGIARGAPAP